MGAIPPAFRPVPRRAWDGDALRGGERAVAEEVAVAFSYNRLAYAVMMATPADLEDFAVGFSLAERIVGAPGEIEELAIVPVEAGIELRMWLPGHRMAAVTERRRALAGPTGCGLCGLESLAETMRAPPAIPAGALRLQAAGLSAAMAAMAEAQALNHRTHAATPPGSGIRRAGSLRCARMSAGTTRSTSWQARSPGRTCRRGKARCC